MNTGAATVNRGEIVSMYAGLNAPKRNDTPVKHGGLTRDGKRVAKMMWRSVTKAWSKRRDLIGVI